MERRLDLKFINKFLVFFLMLLTIIFLFNAIKTTKNAFDQSQNLFSIQHNDHIGQNTFQNVFHNRSNIDKNGFPDNRTVYYKEFQRRLIKIFFEQLTLFCLFIIISFWGYRRLKSEINSKFRYQNKLLESEVKYHWLFDNMNSGVVVYEAVDNGNDFIIKDLNKAAEQIEKIPKNEIINRLVTDAFPGIIEFGLFLLLKKVWETGQSAYLPICFYRDNRIEGWRENFVYKVPSGEVICIYKDKTQQKLDEIKIKESEAKFRFIFNSVADPVFILNRDGKILEANGVALYKYRYTKQDVLKLTFDDLISLRSHFKFDYIKENILRTGEVIVENEHIGSNGKYMQVELNVRKTFFNSKKALIVVVRDITERKKRQQEIMNAVISAEEKERSRIAKDLHDGISPLLSALKIYTQTLTANQEESSEAEAIEKIGFIVNEAIAGVKEISNNLSPHILQNFGLVAAVQAFLERIRVLNKIEITLNYNEEKRVDEKIEITLYRVITELINNTLKHAKAQNIQINMLWTHNQVVLNYSDDGGGFDAPVIFSRRKGMGLFNIVNRIELLKGETVFQNILPNGTQVEIKIPINEHKKTNFHS